MEEGFISLDEEAQYAHLESCVNILDFVLRARRIHQRVYPGD